MAKLCTVDIVQKTSNVNPVGQILVFDFTQMTGFLSERMMMPCKQAEAWEWIQHTVSAVQRINITYQS